MTSKTTPGAPPEWSIVIPAYNEERRLPAYLSSIRNYQVNRSLDAEVLVVDDGSDDGTSDVVVEMQENWPALTLLRTPRNRGKGHAVRSGIGETRGQRVLFADADGATPIEEIERLSRALDEGADLAVGSRALPSRETHVETSLRRKLVGRTFHLLVSLVGIRGIRDTQCGFKAFQGNTGRHLFGCATLDGFGFDVEVLLLAQHMGLAISEVPVNWHHVDGSRVSVLRDSPRMALEVISVRLGLIGGRYAHATPVAGETSTRSGPIVDPEPEKSQ